MAAALVLVGGGLIVAAVTGAFDGGDPTAGAALKTDRFDRDRAFADLRYQVERGPRPAGSDAARELAGWLRRAAAARPARRRCPAASRTWSAASRAAARRSSSPPTTTPRTSRASSVPTTAPAASRPCSRSPARCEKAKRPAGAPPIRFVLFDGEESPDDAKDFYSTGLRGSKHYARRHAKICGR